jgi:5-methylcytosine-specific restriction endonuclease McrA
MPSVIRLIHPIVGMKRAIKFSRVNVFTRDGYRCCYCGTPKKARELNYDHVVPRHLGGKTTWENIVSSCYGCNGRKANRTPEQAGMRLRQKPHRPKTLPMVVPRFDPKEIPAVWAAWVQDYFTADEAVA